MYTLPYTALQKIRKHNAIIFVIQRSLLYNAYSKNVNSNIMPRAIRLSIPPTNFFRPSKIIVSGASRSGKSTLIEHIITNNLITPVPLKIFWISETPVPQSKRISAAIYIDDGIPDRTFFENTTDAVIVLDDCQKTGSDSDTISMLFRRTSHHNRLITFFVVQNLHFSGKSALDIRRNCDYYILFKSPADFNLYKRFQTNFGLTKTQPSLNRMLAQVTRQNPHFCIIIDIQFDTPELLRFRCDPRYGINQQQAYFSVRTSSETQFSRAHSPIPSSASNV